MLKDRRPILLANARVIDPSRDFDGPGDVLIADGVIRDLKRGISAAGVPEGTDVINCAGKVVAPGLIDMRAFVGEPGASHRETFASASQAAATGGITTIVCQPSTSPVIDNSATVDFILRRARDTAIVNIHPMAALTKGLAGDEMTEIGLLKAAGAVAFTDGDRSVTNSRSISEPPASAATSPSRARSASGCAPNTRRKRRSSGGDLAASAACSRSWIRPSICPCCSGVARPRRSANSACSQRSRRTESDSSTASSSGFSESGLPAAGSSSSCR